MNRSMKKSLRCLDPNRRTKRATGQPERITGQARTDRDSAKPRRRMQMTAKARAVLELIAARQDKGYSVGARAVASVLWGNPHKAMRAGGYAGRLMNERWLWRRMVWYRGARGHEVYSHTEYFITEEGRKALKGTNHAGDLTRNRIEPNRTTLENKTTTTRSKPKNESRKNTGRAGQANQS